MKRLSRGSQGLALSVCLLSSALAVSVQANGMSYKGFPYGQCTWYAAQEFDKVAPAPKLKWSGNAGNWLNAAHAAGWQTTTDSRLATNGSIIVWRGGAAGHVGVVRRVDTKSVLIDEWNWPIGAQKRTVTLPRTNLNRSSYTFIGYVLPKRR